MSRRLLVIIPDKLHKKLKIEAVRQGRNLQDIASEIMIEAITGKHDTRKQKEETHANA